MGTSNFKIIQKVPAPIALKVLIELMKKFLHLPLNNGEDIHRGVETRAEPNIQAFQMCF
jgi:hypothetical protein